MFLVHLNVKIYLTLPNTEWDVNRNCTSFELATLVRGILLQHGVVRLVASQFLLQRQSCKTLQANFPGQDTIQCSFHLQRKLFAAVDAIDPVGVDCSWWTHFLFGFLRLSISIDLF
jgi:hypothetical protein